MKFTTVKPLLFIGLLAILYSGCSHQQSQFKPKNTIITSAFVTHGPIIDGKGIDLQWQTISYKIKVKDTGHEDDGQQTDTVKIKSIHTDSHIYFLVSWSDASYDKTHKTWIWNETEKRYENGADREDVLSLAFQHTNTFNPDMLAGIESAWDTWYWKAARTDPGGYAMDKMHYYSKTKPDIKAKSFEEVISFSKHTKKHKEQ